MHTVLTDCVNSCYINDERKENVYNRIARRSTVKKAPYIAVFGLSGLSVKDSSFIKRLSGFMSDRAS